MVGGLFLCYEGFEKLAHKFLAPRGADEAHHAELTQALADPAVDMATLEREKIKGAVRTDFVLSAEIIAITLGIVANAGFPTQVAVLSGIALVMTVGVYGLVAGIVKLDDAGLWLSRRGGARATVGRAILHAAPWLMKSLSVAGTAAMFLVGGGILTHGVPALHDAVTRVTAGWGGALHGLASMAADGVVGITAGALCLLGVSAATQLRASFTSGN